MALVDNDCQLEQNASNGDFDMFGDKAKELPQTVRWFSFLNSP